MIAITSHAEGCVLPVRAQPGAKKNAVRGEQAGSLKVSVTVAPEQGKANKAVLETICEALSLKNSQLELLNGETSRDKRFLVRGLTPVELEARLSELLK